MPEDSVIDRNRKKKKIECLMSVYIEKTGKKYTSCYLDSFAKQKKEKKKQVR